MKKQSINITVHSQLVCTIAIIIISVLLSAGPAFGQFMVQPMTINLAPRPAKTTSTTFKLQNYGADVNDTQIVDLTLVDLTQWPDGTWRFIGPEEEFDRSTLSSCRSWLKLNKTSIEVKPLRIVSVGLTIKVPTRTRGFYAAGILVTTRPTIFVEAEVSVRVQYLVPVILEIQGGRAMRHKIDLHGVGMSFSEPNGLNPATTILSVNIENNGGTFSSLNVFGRVRSFSNGHWRDITKMEFRDAGIIPGAKLMLESNIGRSLPSGRYKVAAALYVDGRRVRIVEKELSFVGDPTIQKVASDVALTVTPAEAVVKGLLPGATRTTVVRVRNDSDETVNVKAHLSIPPLLYGAVFGDLIGNELDCSGWLKIMPEQFQLRRGNRQNIRVIAKMPKGSNKHACYYALLSLNATYPDGQNAGVKTSYICVVDNTVEAILIAQPARLTVSAMEESRYFIVARFANYGNIHYTPRCSATITTLTGLATGKPILLSSSSVGAMLPLEFRSFSGVADLKDYSAGIYNVIATITYASGEETTYQIPIRVSIEGNQRIVETIQPERPGEKIGIELTR